VIPIRLLKLKVETDLDIQDLNKKRLQMIEDRIIKSINGLYMEKNIFSY
jgi:hypothetical protein